MNSMTPHAAHRVLPGWSAPMCVALGLLVGFSGAPNSAWASASPRAPVHSRAWTPPRTPARDFQGLGLGMSREAAHERLDRVGHVQGGKSEEGDSETWALPDRRYGFVTVGFDRSGRVGWYSLFARRGGQPVLMREIGDLAYAQKQGNYIYLWTLPPRDGRPACKVIVRSQDPDTLRSLSVFALNPEAPAQAAPPDSAR